MDWSDDLRCVISSKLSNYEVYFSPADVPQGTLYPPQWGEFGYRSQHRMFMPSKWAEFSGCLPWVSDWLEKCVIGTVLAVGDSVYLMYVYREEGEIYFYVGGRPLAANHTENARFKSLPAHLQDFYTQLHDGFGFYIGFAMGPSRFEDFVEIDELCDEEEVHYPGVLAIFSSGTGDYLCINEDSACADAIIWWHEDPSNPLRGVKLWNMMDAWMCVFLENCDSNEV